RLRGRQHQDAGARPASDERAADVVAVNLGQVPVEQDHVGAVSGSVAQRVLAVEGDIDWHSLTAKPDRNRGGELLVVLDYEHAHPGALLCPSCRRMPQLRLHAGDSSCTPGVTDSAVSLLGSRSCCFEKELSVMRCRHLFIITSAVSAGAFALLAAGCGGGGASPGVASVASSTTSARTTRSSSRRSGPARAICRSSR